MALKFIQETRVSTQDFSPELILGSQGMKLTKKTMQIIGAEVGDEITIVPDVDEDTKELNAVYLTTVKECEKNNVEVAGTKVSDSGVAAGLRQGQIYLKMLAGEAHDFLTKGGIRLIFNVSETATEGFLYKLSFSSKIDESESNSTKVEKILSTKAANKNKNSKKNVAEVEVD